MKRLLCIALLFASQNSLAFELEGNWTEDVDKTILWNYENRKVSNEYLEEFKAISGHFYIKFKNGVMCQYFEPFTIKYNGKENEVPRLTTIHAKYKVIAKNAHGIVYELEYESGDTEIEMVVFETKTSMYGNRLTTEDFDQPGSRVYLKPVADNKWSYDCKFT